MTDLSTLEAVLADPLAQARSASSAIGCYGTDLPEDLLAAFGASVHLPWEVGQPTPAADLWLEDSFPCAARSVLQAWADGAFDSLDHVLFTRGEDSSQRLYYYVCELQRRGDIKGPEPLIFDVAKIGRPTSVDHSIAAVRKLAQQLGITAERLAAGIGEADRRRRALARHAADRRAAGSLYERIGRASLFDPAIFDIVPGALPADTFDGRLLLAGSAPPDDRLHLGVEAQGWTMVGELYDRGLDRLGPEIGSDGPEDPFVAVGRHAHAGRTGARSFGDRAQWLLAEARRTRADGVLLWLVAEEEALVWHVPRQRRLLEANGIPVLVLANRRWDAADGTMEEIARFIEGLKA